MYGPPRWWSTWKALAKAELEEKPCTDGIFGIAFLSDAVGSCGCTSCTASLVSSGRAMEELRRDVESVLADIDDAEVVKRVF